MTGAQGRIVKVLVVEDSPVVRELLIQVLSSDPEIKVVGVSRSGEEAIDAVEQLKPDVITMDIHLPKMNGFDTTRRIMETCPTPVVIVSGSANTKEETTAMRATQAGALAVVPKPAGPGRVEHEDRAAKLIQAVKLMSEVKVLTRWARPPRTKALREVSPPAELELSRSAAQIQVVAIGASTGGPPVLQTILSRLPKDFPIPVLVVQHMADGFIQWFVDWLEQECAVRIQVAAHGDLILPGHVYLAPDGAHMNVSMGGRLWLTKEDPENGLRPSVSHLFRSVANAYGRNAIGVLLTGMGKDGAKELKLMKDEGAITLVQDKASSVVHGMPGEALSLNAASYVLSPDKIAETVISLANPSERRTSL
ncbi:MAG TPA: chemotaxis-specific protein-glutamate methyltransferase CheB [Candidatus Aquilonibacter sp.]|nr:chemotaxis-specific protein-glutamate methyltransferase CheB [Candidatus Aquilonibacter sp.]